MNEALQKQTIMVFGESYTIVSDESPQCMKDAVALVDELMRGIASQTHNQDAKRCAVLCSLQLALECVQLRRSLALAQDKQEALARVLDRTLAASG